MEEKKWINLVKRKETVLFDSLVFAGSTREYYEASVGIPFSLKNYKYINWLHSISSEDAKRMRGVCFVMRR